jgi:hypothetical protein
VACGATAQQQQAQYRADEQQFFPVIHVFIHVIFVSTDHGVFLCDLFAIDNINNT